MRAKTELGFNPLSAVKPRDINSGLGTSGLYKVSIRSRRLSREIYHTRRLSGASNNSFNPLSAVKPRDMASGALRRYSVSMFQSALGG